ncbi:MAG: hypothetical protein H6575_17215 [Lewinellaceae bacterium]|nr:hypothetical protein [Saprospiraceae bacterium]MCB9356307.1 hypothetical protein [Lewinellaceae bacterium]
MTSLLLFFDTDELLGDEWLASAIGIAITYVVFIMGVPALIFQTFIPDALRNMYNERVGGRWPYFFIGQIFLILFLFIESNRWVHNHGATSSEDLAMNLFYLTLFVIAIILFSGIVYLHKKFKSSQNIEQQLSKKIVDDALKYYRQHQNLNKKDLEDLGILAKELPAGRKKNIFLEECERLTEYLLDQPPKERDDKLIGVILDEVVCLSVTYDSGRINNENMRKALDILILSYSKIRRNGDARGNAMSSYLNTTIGNCMKEIGIIAMLKNDLLPVMDAIEKLSSIEGTSREMFTLGNEALLQGHVQTAVAATKKLGGKVKQNLSTGDLLRYNEKRTLFFWLGLVANIYMKKGAARQFAKRQMNFFIEHFSGRPADMQTIFGEAKVHFYHQADFATTDAVEKMEKAIRAELR